MTDEQYKMAFGIWYVDYCQKRGVDLNCMSGIERSLLIDFQWGEITKNLPHVRGDDGEPDDPHFECTSWTPSPEKRQAMVEAINTGIEPERHQPTVDEINGEAA